MRILLARALKYYFKIVRSRQESCKCYQRRMTSTVSKQTVQNNSVSDDGKGILGDISNNKYQYLNPEFVSPWKQTSAWESYFHQPIPYIDWDFLCDPQNYKAISTNIANRKGTGNIEKVNHLWIQHQSAKSLEEKKQLWEELLCEALKIPNSTHPSSPIGDESKAFIVEIHGKKRGFEFQPKTVVELGENLQMLKIQNLAMTTGPRTYYLIGDLVRLERALVQFALQKLRQKGFFLVSVPDMLHPNVIEGCGFKTQGERTQVYKLATHIGQVCLSGTAEMSLAGFFANRLLDLQNLPIKVAAVSRCYRAETSDIAEEKGIYRVHQFTKVEMFGVSADEVHDESEQLLLEFLEVERELFASLGLHFRVLDMPTEELGAPAHRKFDIEAWMPGKEFWGEISSASNCTNFQSGRLSIRYKNRDGNLKLAHTVNGTACAVPRMLMTLMENNQCQDGSIILPESLYPWMGSTTILKPPQHRLFFTSLHKNKK